VVLRLVAQLTERQTKETLLLKLAFWQVLRLAQHTTQCLIFFTTLTSLIPKQSPQD